MNCTICRFVQIAVLWVICCGAEKLAAGDFFSFDNRVFSRAEAEMIAGKSGDLKKAVTDNRIAVAIMVLCEHSGVKLSQSETRRSLQESFMLMPQERRNLLTTQLEKENLTFDQWLDRESGKFTNQLNDAVRRWYMKNYGSAREITSEHIRNWYYRNQNIFRRIRIDPDGIWAFAADDNDSLQQAFAALRQGMMPCEVRRKYALTLSEKEIANALHSAGSGRQMLTDGYIRVTGGKYQFLLKKDAVAAVYVNLDGDLEKAIGNALYDALAKARLELLLKEYLQGKTINFY